MSENKSSIELLFEGSLDDEASSRPPADPFPRGPEPTPENPEIRPSGKRIPVADDMKVMRFKVRGVAEAVGHEVSKLRTVWWH